MLGKFNICSILMIVNILFIRVFFFHIPIAKQIQSTLNVPIYQTDKEAERKLLATFSDKMCALKSQEKKFKESDGKYMLLLII